MTRVFYFIRRDNYFKMGCARFEVEIRVWFREGVIFVFYLF